MQGTGQGKTIGIQTLKTCSGTGDRSPKSSILGRDFCEPLKLVRYMSLPLQDGTNLVFEMLLLCLRWRCKLSTPNFAGQESKSAAKRPRSDSDGEPETKAARTGGGGLSCVAAQASRSAQISTHRAQVAAPKPAPTSSHSVKRCHAKHETTGQQILARTSNPAAAQPSAETAAKAATKKAKNAAKKAEKAAAEISAKKAAKATAQAPPQPAAETAPRPRYDPLKDYFPPTRVESLAEYIENLIGLNDEKQQWELVEFLENMLPIPLTPAKDGTVPLDLSALSWVSLWKLDKFLLCNSGGQYKPVILWLVPRTCSSTGLIYAEDDEDTDDELDMYRRI